MLQLVSVVKIVIATSKDSHTLMRIMQPTTDITLLCLGCLLYQFFRWHILIERSITIYLIKNEKAGFVSSDYPKNLVDSEVIYNKSKFYFVL